MAFSAHWLNGGKTGDDVRSVMNTSFTEFSTAASATSNYGVFLKNLKNKATESVTDPNNPSAPCSTVQKCTSRQPSTIREMLYFLAALQFSSAYDELNEHIGTVLNKALDVADSSDSKPDNTLSSDQLKEYLRASCSFSSCVLGAIQGPGTSQTDTDPWLFELFCNSQFKLSIPSSGAFLFSKVSNYAYALQFQLSFLYIQCRNTYTIVCGWQECRFGKDINKSTASQIVPSHICPTGCTKSTSEHSQGDHAQGNCEHEGCGQESSNLSPLQAFLTDNLNGFSRGHPSDLSSHLATCSGYMCHVPMGFTNHLRAGGNSNGSHISLTLKPLCGSCNTPLRQLSEKLGCLTKRTPRLLGDLFGFMWHLNGQLFKSGKSAEESLKEFFKTLGLENYSGNSHTSPSEFLKLVTAKITRLGSSPSKTIEKALSLIPGLPFWYNLFMVKPDDSLPAVLFKVKNIPHQRAKEPTYSGHHNDLYSLYNPVCTTQEKNCGPYLFPLTHSDGATYNPAHASTYLSWVLYLSDDLQSWFQDMLDEFKNIDCKTLGCVKCKDGTHKPGEHGVSTNCSCDSVVQCGGTLPLLYRHAFRYNNPILLMGMTSGNGGDARKCSAFTDQLQSVISGNPLSSLLTSIDAFLYAIRWEFFSKLSGFWTIYVCIILYTFFFLLDTLRVRSHLHFPSSHVVPPLVLLTQGTPLPITKLTYIGQ
ncbi:extracellular matrix-binding ebh [Babesia caballi]|uniref:Extracellular matrix-binding ebh n=1 Tax=Babesia caballi TaxID=5871 RepID=A0AAV4LQ20_BABCB|nr:extracellular matrix-binding ebh [Babesia caballi]